jgi:hypothetical protein
MKILAIPCKARDLKPGDLFSAAGPEYWVCAFGDLLDRTVHFEDFDADADELEYGLDDVVRLFLATSEHSSDVSDFFGVGLASNELKHSQEQWRLNSEFLSPFRRSPVF